MIKYISGNNIYLSDFFETKHQELGKLDTEDNAKRVDFVCLTKDNTIVNLEMNRTKGQENINIISNKSRTYNGHFTAKYYSFANLKHYIGKIKVNQYNFNTFYNLEDKTLEYDTTIPFNLEEQRLDDYFITYNIYLPRLKELADETDIDIYNDFAIFMCESEEELKKYIKGNKERQELYNYLKKLEKEDQVMSDLEHEEMIKTMSKNEGREEGREEGFKEGEGVGLAKGLELGEEKGLTKGLELGEEKIAKIVKNLYASNASLEYISDTAEIPIEKIKKILNLSEEIE